MRIMFDSLSLATFCPRRDGCPDEGGFAHSLGIYNGIIIGNHVTGTKDTRKIYVSKAA